MSCRSKLKVETTRASARWLTLAALLTTAALPACIGGEDPEPPLADGGRPDGGPVDAAPDVPAPPPDGSSPDVLPDGGIDGNATVTRRLVILHTNDLHSHLNGHSPEADHSPTTTGDDGTIGGFARLAALVGRERQAATGAGHASLLLDAGDFMMGTLFELLATTNASELTMMNALGYDATTLGNHEFDWTPRGLAGILAAAVKQKITLPILASNMRLDPSDPGDDELAMLLDPGPIKRRLVKQVGGLRVGLFGLMGKNAAAVTPTMRPVTFEDLGVAAAREVSELRNVHKVDLVIALSHAGINSQGQGEDAELAKQVAGIDVIVSGHSHDTLETPVRIGSTWIVTAGAYGSHLGRLALDVTVGGGQTSVALADHTLLPVNDTIAGDAAVQAQVEAYIAGLDGVLATSGLGYRKVLAETGVDLPRGAAQEWPVGNLVTDAYRAVVSTLQPTAPPQVAVDANGQIRTSILRGKTGQIWFADVFRVLPLGIGPDAVPGYPLVTLHVTPKELRSGFELGAAAELVGGDSFLQLSGAKVQVDGTRAPFSRVTSLKLVNGATEETLDLNDTSRCVKVTTTYLVANFLGLVKSLTGGALEVTPKRADCQTVITDWSQQIVDRDPATTGTQELKHWQALSGYLGKLPDTDGDLIPNVPAAYGAAQGRFVRQ